jgi:hypothetical protein
MLSVTLHVVVLLTIVTFVVAFATYEKEKTIAKSNILKILFFIMDVFCFNLFVLFVLNWVGSSGFNGPDHKNRRAKFTLHFPIGGERLFSFIEPNLVF